MSQGVGGGDARGKSIKVFKDFIFVSSKDKLFQKTQFVPDLEVIRLWLCCEGGEDGHGKEQVQAWNNTQDLCSAVLSVPGLHPTGDRAPLPAPNPTCRASLELFYSHPGTEPSV